ncbi:MAG: spermidine/putrescine ABC transporter substrate-binding protein [Desulfamplus sp.]|nr:spermidine/putrescine ABC transporter substrate-binding protein [Desulfamplus sp.]
MKNGKIFVKSTVITALLVLIALFSGGCSTEKKELYIYNWSDYINENLVKSFEEENSCKIILDYFDSNETMYAKLKAGAAGYDIVFPSGYMVGVMAKEGMLLKLDHSKIPNLKNIDKKYISFSLDEQHEFSVPYMISNTGIGYLKSKAGETFEPSWNIFADPKYKGRMTMLNDMREAIGAALKYLGYSINTTDLKELEEAKGILMGWKQNIAKFEADQYKNGLVSGEFYFCQGYNGDIFQVRAENADIGYAIPKEGTTLSSDNMVILNSSKNPDLAYKFINFMLDGKVSAENIEYVQYLAPNKEAYQYLSDGIKSDPAILMPEHVLNRCEVIIDLGNDNALYSKIWDQVKSAR